MSLLKNNYRSNIERHSYMLASSLMLIVISLVLSNTFSLKGYYPVPLPNFAIVALVYMACYLDVFLGIVFSYAVLYIYGSLTALNPALIAFSGTISFGTAYFLWRKVGGDNVLFEIGITFIASLSYYILLFLSIFYGIGIHFDFFYLFVFRILADSIITALISPVVFIIFKKIAYGHILKSKKIITY